MINNHAKHVPCSVVFTITMVKHHGKLNSGSSQNGISNFTSPSESLSFLTWLILLNGQAWIVFGSTSKIISENYINSITLNMCQNLGDGTIPMEFSWHALVKVRCAGLRRWFNHLSTVHVVCFASAFRIRGLEMCGKCWGNYLGNGGYTGHTDATSPDILIGFCPWQM